MAGQIFIALVVNKEDPACVGPFPISWEYCHYTFREPLDGCDDDAVNGKHGGMLLQRCMWFVVDPAPAYNQPYPFGVLN